MNRHFRILWSNARQACSRSMPLSLARAEKEADARVVGLAHLRMNANVG